MTTHEPTSSINPIRILVVDDHPNTATTLARALTQLGSGVSVTSALSGNDALEKVKTTGVDILFTDMIMPEMTGLELIEKLQRHPAGRPSYTYLVTAYEVPGLKVTAQRLKVNEVIVKPVRPERICQIATHAIEEMRHITRPSQKITSARKKFKILVADDKPDNITLLTRYLEYEGFENITARDGLETLDKVRDELPDLILLDVNMPQKDGFTVLEEIRSDPVIKHIPVIILSAARLDPTDVQSGLNLGADDYVTKPFDRHELMARIRTKLRVKEAEDVIRRRNRELNLLPEIGKGLGAHTDINKLINVVLRRSAETLGAIAGYMQIINLDGSPLKKSFSTSNVEMDFPKLDEFFKSIGESHESIIISDTRNDSRWQAGQINLLHSVVIVPMFGRNALLGLLVLAHEQADYFESEHLLLLQAIASQAAIAIENANLYSSMAQEQKRLAAVLNYAAEAMLMFDAQGKLSLLNPAGENLFTDFKANINQPLPLGRGYDALINMLEDARNSLGTKSGDVLWPDKRTFTTLITPIEGGGQVVILHDVSRFKDLDRVKNEFIATASHDLKNPLTNIEGFSDLLAQAGPLNADQKDFVKRIQNATRTMNELIQSMLSLVQIDLNAVSKNENMDLIKVLAELEGEFKPQIQLKQQMLSFNLSSSPALINGDISQIRQLFRNLIGNAIKYTPKGGTITLTAKTKDSQALVELKDNGYGIPASDLPLIFNRFYRVRSGKNEEEEGNGLGLAIVKSIVEQHDGQISVESEPHKGSCFSVSIPLSHI